ncbi:MAG: hypothetical protein ACRC1G_04280, partial [Bradyrhizobium sp.]
MAAHHTNCKAFWNDKKIIQWTTIRPRRHLFVLGWERCAPAIRLCLLEEPKPGRPQAVKAEAAKRGRDSASLYGLR